MKTPYVSGIGMPVPDRLKGRLILIHAMPRTASTSLRYWLDAQETVVFHGEILGPNRVLGTSDKQDKKFSMGPRNRYPYRFAQVYFGAHEHRWIGFKALSSHLLERRNTAFLRWFFDMEPKVIQQYRTDLVARYRSALFHRLDRGYIDSDYVLNLSVGDVLADCISTYEQWRMADQCWTANCDSVTVNMQESTDQIQSKLECFLSIKIQSDMPDSNTESTQTAQTDHVSAVAYVEELCSHSSLDQFRTIALR